MNQLFDIDQADDVGRIMDAKAARARLIQETEEAEDYSRHESCAMFADSTYCKALRAELDAKINGLIDGLESADPLELGKLKAYREIARRLTADITQAREVVNGRSRSSRS